MKKIDIVTFKGCQSSVNLQMALEKMVQERGLDVEAELVIVPSAGKAEEMNLFGSPTLFIAGNEYQKERRGPAGMY